MRKDWALSIKSVEWDGGHREGRALFAEGLWLGGSMASKFIRII